MFKNLLKEKNLSVYQCSKLSGIPYSTLSDIFNGNTNIEKCSCDVAYRLSKTLGVSMEYLIEVGRRKFDDFENFKSIVKHRIKEEGDITFLLKVYMGDEIEKYWEDDKKAEALYLLACVDYLSRINELPKATRYNEIRNFKLEEPIWPQDAYLLKKIMPKSYEENLLMGAIPEFLQFNIVEGDLRDAC